MKRPITVREGRRGRLAIAVALAVATTFSPASPVSAESNGLEQVPKADVYDATSCQAWATGAVPMVRFLILGPIEFYGAGRRRDVAGPRQLALLTVLLVHANRAVSADRLIDLLWGERRSPGATKRLQMAVARLRKALHGNDPCAIGEPALKTVSGGYLLAVGPGELDADVFQERVRDGRRALDERDPARAARTLREALELWRGPAFAEVAYADYARGEIERLEEMRLAALEARLDADLQLGRHAALVGELDALVAEHRLHERLHAQRMLALYRCGRQAEALEAYQDARRILVSEIGIEPGAPLQRLHAAILRHDSSLEPDWIGGESPPAGGDRALAKLPFPRALAIAARSPFVGHEQELAQLRGMWAETTRGMGTAIVVGQPGVGKTRLAAALARSVHDAGGLVRYGRCDEGLAVPFQPFVEALRSAATAIGLHRLRAALGPVAAPLARLWPELEGLGEPPRADPETERYRLFEAVTALLEVVTRERPMLLVVDDLHWATQPTRLMLRHVVRSERPLRALIVAICRETELTADQANPLPAELRRDTGATTVPIGALDKNATATQLEALAGHAPDQRATELVQQLRRRPAAIRPASAN